MTHYHSDSQTQYDMAKFISTISYLTLVGWLVAIVLYGKNHSTLASFHLRQSLGLIVTAAVLSFIPLFGWLLNLVVAFFWFVAIYHTVLGHKFLVPVLGQFYQENLDFIR
ncbi:hypothetical protein [Thalassotalea profundi]|uniref:DUF4870 domain-containing protein n=1 Tax=Thalassotalea profundi TaxID=2036687 RepID=A0ABQ3IQ77_9GAMM|nr:hypothetical protein [Thalassotalea profundi]GHE91101.1 hypothetical protein GCM10011501_20690 [Thalassotalea profundi]